METVLLFVTIISLLIAVVMSVVGWRSLRDDRQRSAARAEALATLASGEPDAEARVAHHHVRESRDMELDGETFSADEVPQEITPEYAAREMNDIEEPAPVQSRRVVDAVPAVMTAEESDWDLALGATSMEQDDDWEDDFRAVPPAPRYASAPVMRHTAQKRRAQAAHRSRPAARRMPPPAPSYTDAISDDMFGATPVVHAPARRWVALVAVAAVMAVGVFFVYSLYRPTLLSASSNSNLASSDTRAALNTATHPLELLSLKHSAESSGEFVVTGLVQNPMAGQAVRKVVAIVYLFDRDGTYFASGRAALEQPALEPGADSPFVVRVPNVGKVGRYRVGFRLEDGAVVAHVDRRGQEPQNTTGTSSTPGPNGAGDSLEPPPAAGTTDVTPNRSALPAGTKPNSRNATRGNGQ